MPLQAAIFVMSLECSPAHSFAHKLDMAKKYVISGIELWWEDLLAVRKLRGMCDKHSLQIISIQSFYHYEGLRDRSIHEQQELTDDAAVRLADLRKMADLGLDKRPIMRFCYESLAWDTNADTWEKSLEVVQQVDRPNFGICLDAFNIAARVFADSAAPSGCARDGMKELVSSLERLRCSVEPAKVFLVQLVDAGRLKEPLVEGHELYQAAQPSRMSWSRNCRLFYGEHGGYLPIREIAWCCFMI
ncbi:hypothetical protein EJ05DRAFT_489838 [Pseudovirgaria hyperparasitica]|uniref:Uncharacterized protein n=1 Tax=Pseudovirgaria hyperparasitica TaxID=470096 RepID=A0A6A6VVK0_9PEZI|nr:uncharacterized protein EJ05DRAFT_489838 [Pseudovirgaria hyperparasitica]KAF2753650.1 hypothetical protein EJ05DRAFT_489838 [Pseudovirgaria hyperparasitica]